MRKIEQAMIDVLLDEGEHTTAWMRSNTFIAWGKDDDGELTAHVTLHETTIAQWTPNSESLFLKHGGYETPTTKSRLNALLEGLGTRHRIRERNHEWFLVNIDTGFDTPFGEWAYVQTRVV